MIRCSFSHLRPWGNCVRAAGKLPSQSPSGDSSLEGRAKSRPPLWGALVPSGHRSALDRAGRREWHAKGMTERARCQRPLRMGCVEALASCPLSRLAATAPPKGEPSLASPFGGRWCPVGTVQRLTEPAGESGLALARTERASCRPHHPLPWLSPLRARPPRSLVFLAARP